jgi:general secretion pathway protein G
LVIIQVGTTGAQRGISLLENKIEEILRYAIHSKRSLIFSKKLFGGFTLVELLVVIAILGTLSGIAIPAYNNYIEKAKIVTAIAEISIIQKEITEYETANNVLPNTLNDIGRVNLLDPWDNPYQYLNFANVAGKGKMRKDRFLVPLNSDYDLYSMGKDGLSEPPLTANASHDDIIRANNGTYIGIASEY